MAFFTKESLLVTYAYLYLVMEKHGMLDHQVEESTLASALAMKRDGVTAMITSRDDQGVTASKYFNRKNAPSGSSKSGKAGMQRMKEQQLLQNKADQRQQVANKSYGQNNPMYSGNQQISMLSSEYRGATTSTKTRENAKKPLVISEAMRETNPNVAKGQKKRTLEDRLLEAKKALSQPTRLERARDTPYVANTKDAEIAGRRLLPIQNTEDKDSPTTASSSPNDTTKGSSECPGRGPLKEFLQTRRLQLEALKKLVGTKEDQEVDVQELEQDERDAQARCKKTDEDEQGKLFNKYQVTCQTHEWQPFGQRVYCSNGPICAESKNRLKELITDQKNSAKKKVFDTDAEIAKKMKEMKEVLGTLVDELKEIQDGPGQQCPAAHLKVEHMNPRAAQRTYQLTIQDCTTANIAKRLDELNAIA